MSEPKTDRGDIAKRMLNKVPEVTIFFWIIKVLCTTVGETAADFLNINLHLGLTITTIILSVFLAVALAVQFRLRQYVPGVYWLLRLSASPEGCQLPGGLPAQCVGSTFSSVPGRKFGCAMLLQEQSYSAAIVRVRGRSCERW